MNEKIIAKVRKLLAVANGSAAGGEHERDTAMRMALKLLAAHNMSMASVADAPQEGRISETDMYHSTPWMGWVGNAMAKLFFCHMFTTKVHGKNKKVFTFVGLESNVATAKEMTAYLIKSITKESAVAMAKYGQGETFGNSFRKGAADRIYSRCEKLRQEAEAESDAANMGTGTALVLSSLYKTQALANVAHIKEVMGIDLKETVATTRNNDALGTMVGKQFGDRVNLNRQLGGSDNSSKRIA